MRRITAIIADLDAGRPLKPSEEMAVKAHFEQAALKELNTHPGKNPLEPNVAVKVFDTIAGLTGLLVAKTKEVGTAAVEVGNEHRARTIKQQIENLHAERAVVEDKFKRNVIDQAEYEEAIAGIEADLEKYAQ